MVNIIAFKTVEEMSLKIDEYFFIANNRTETVLAKTGEIIKIPSPAPVHISGLCAHLDISNETLNQYQKKEGFGDLIRRAKKKCEAYAADQCFEGKKGNKADFVLKNNFREDWGDEHTIKHAGAITHNHNIIEDLLSAFNKLRK